MIFGRIFGKSGIDSTSPGLASPKSGRNLNGSFSATPHDLRPASILESKRAFRRELAARPIGEKLRMLDALRERELAMSAPKSKGINKTKATGESPFTFSQRRG